MAHAQKNKNKKDFYTNSAYFSTSNLYANFLLESISDNPKTSPSAHTIASYASKVPSQCHSISFRRIPTRTRRFVLNRTSQRPQRVAGSRCISSQVRRHRNILLLELFDLLHVVFVLGFEPGARHGAAAAGAEVDVFG